MMVGGELHALAAAGVFRDPKTRHSRVSLAVEDTSDRSGLPHFAPESSAHPLCGHYWQFFNAVLVHSKGDHPAKGLLQPVGEFGDLCTIPISMATAPEAIESRQRGRPADNFSLFSCTSPVRGDNKPCAGCYGLSF